jgi:DNA-binding beta-propeller fold protein YncE
VFIHFVFLHGFGFSQFEMPWDVAVDSGNNVFVPDYGNNRIQVFSNNGIYLRDWGTEGRAPENLIIQQ